MTKALVKTEEEAPKVELVMPKAFSFIELKKDADVNELPIAPAPYFVVAQEGTFMRMKSTLGVSVLRVDEMPKTLGKVGHKAGFFDWDAPSVPPEICAQIVDFFRRIWNKHKAEAEVLLTARIEKVDGFHVIQEWKVFVPTQKVSMGGVESVYEPTHIKKGFQVVGTMHSHCNFSAFHSSTDTNDASTFDGLHLTIGFVDRKKPEVTAMVSINGYRVDMDKSLEKVADFSDLDAATAPPWWDNYVIPTKDLNTNHRPKGMELFDRYPNKSTTVPSSQSSHARGYSDGWGGHGYGAGYGAGYGGHGVNNSKVYCSHPQSCECEATPNHMVCCRSFADECKHALTCSCNIETHKKCCAANKGETKPLSDLLKEENAKEKTQEEEALGDQYWEDFLDKNLRDKLYNELLSTKDITSLMDLPDKDEERAVQVMLFKKMAAARDILNQLGIDIEFTTSVGKKATPKKQQGKGQTRGKRQN